MIAEILIHLLLVSSAVGLCYLWWWSWYHRVVRMTLRPQRFRAARLFTEKKRVAVLCDRVTPDVTRFLSGLEAGLAHNPRRIEYAIEIHEGSHHNHTTRKRLRAIMKEQFDCLVTTGLFPTQIAQDTLAHHSSPLPLVFGMVSYTESHIVQHPTAYTWTTGVLTDRNLTKELSRLTYLTPRIKHTLIITPSKHWHWVEKDVEQIRDFLKINQSTVTTHQLDDHNLEPILAQLNGINLLIVLRNAATPEEITQLSDHCKHLGVTLYTTNIDDVTHGAGIGTGGGEESIGTQVAGKVVDIVEQRIPPHHVPISHHQPPHRIRLNQKTAIEQAILLSESDLFVIGRGEMLRN